MKLSRVKALAIHPVSLFLFLLSLGALLFLLQVSLRGFSASLTHLQSFSNGDNGAQLLGAESVFVDGDYAYVVSRFSDSLEIIDVSDLLTPTRVGHLIDGEGGAELNGPSSVVVQDGYAYITANYGDALEVVDVSDPTTPVHVGSLTHGEGGAILDGALSVKVSGNYAYVASYVGDALEIIDISDPSNPRHAGVLRDTLGGAQLDGASDVAVSGNYAYVASQFSAAFQIINISDPSNPVAVGILQDSRKLRQIRSVTLEGNYAYVTARSALAFHIIDISDPTNPDYVGNVRNGAGGAKLNDPRSVVIYGGKAYIASFRSDAVEVVDLTNKGVPAHSGYLNKSKEEDDLKFPTSLFMKNGVLFVTSFLSPGSLEIIGVDPQPDVSVTPVPYDFLDLPIGETNIQTFTVKNSGYDTLAIGNVTLEGEGTNFEIINDGCSLGTLEPREECYLDVSFSPEFGGEQFATLSVETNVPSKTEFSLSILGTGGITVGDDDDDDNDVGSSEFVAICHIPPGNTENKQRITVPESALSAHLAHGDNIGPCEERSTEEFPAEINGNGSFTTNADSNMTIRVLGTEITYGAGGPDVPVELEARVGNDTYTIFSGTSVDVAGAEPLVLENVPVGTTAHFKGTSYHPYQTTRKLYSQTTQSGSALIIVLRNGDSLPNATPYGQQPAISDILSDYINEEGIVTIGNNEVIYLFELGTNSPSSSSADFQDAALLVTFPE
ncbi:choice-of-anchor D domain-containing protein [Candidatus Peregrinibacteria bacterium]|nr:MAG: choice-of-anchor D domain-containing protein [Candidatus Peregrinibacteria bacterium]